MYKNFTEKESIELIEKVKITSFILKKSRIFEQRKLVDISLYEKALACGYPKHNGEIKTRKKYRTTYYYDDIKRLLKEEPCDFIITKGVFLDKLDLNDLGVWVTQKTMVSPFPKIDIKERNEALYYKILRSNIHKLLQKIKHK